MEYEIKDYLFLPLLVIGTTLGYIITKEILQATIYKRKEIKKND